MLRADRPVFSTRRISCAARLPHRSQAETRSYPYFSTVHRCPSVDALPEDVGALTHLNAVFVRHTSFNQDLELLEDAIFSRRPRSPVTRFFRRRPILTGALKSLGGVLAAGALLVALAALHSELSGGRALDESLGSKGVVWLLILTVLALGAALPLVLRRKH